MSEVQRYIDQRDCTPRSRPSRALKITPTISGYPPCGVTQRRSGLMCRSGWRRADGLVGRPFSQPAVLHHRGTEDTEGVCFQVAG